MVMTKIPKPPKPALLMTSVSLLLPGVASAVVTDGHRYPTLPKVSEIRERLKQLDQQEQRSGFNAEILSGAGDKWLAWGNWGNWNNWPNWGNWGNWPDWGNWGNY